MKVGNDRDGDVLSELVLLDHTSQYDQKVTRVYTYATIIVPNDMYDALSFTSLPLSIVFQL